ncbi:MAG: DUF507 family protein [Campylobacterales bacterium]|nr:DUF507 family protein [Campylobacterales bacterium]
MRVRLPHAPYIANKIGIDLFKSNLVEMTKGLDSVKKIAEEILIQDIKNEMKLEEKVREILEKNEEDIEFYRADYKQLFWLAKKKLAPEFGIILSRDDRYNHISHEILNTLLEKGLISFSGSENRIKNIIYNAIELYLKSFEELEVVVIEKIENYKRPLIPGTEEYDIVFQKLYEEELKKRGLL